jgi:hypothetical protein
LPWLVKEEEAAARKLQNPAMLAGAAATAGAADALLTYADVC